MLKLSEQSISWALNHILFNNDTNIFPVPFEYDAIDFDKSNFFDYITKQDLHTWQTRTHHKYLVPKHRFGFRISSLLDPIDTIIYTALLHDIGQDLEDNRVPVADNVVFSNRFKENNPFDFFDTTIDYNLFQEHSKQIISDNNISHVVIADIADFFPRLYFHPLENMLDTYTTKRNHTVAIKKLIKGWNHNVSYGIPVGQAASSLLAEATINDVDQTLLLENTLFCRYVDDFRIFCRSEREAYEKLCLLANLLFENHGLTLQMNKTRIISVNIFEEQILRSYEQREVDSLREVFSSVLDEIGASPYDTIEFDDLEPEKQEKIKLLNLETILKEQCEAEVLDLPMVRFALRRLSQINNIDCIAFILENLNTLYPVFRSVMQYFKNLTILTDDEKRGIGKMLLDSFQKKSIAHLPYHRIYMFDLFADDAAWLDPSEYIKLLDSETDDIARRTLLLAIARSKSRGWYKANRRKISQMSTWQKRAFLRGASCMAKDELKHWYPSITDLDQLDRAVIAYSKANPI